MNSEFKMDMRKGVSILAGAGMRVKNNNELMNTIGELLVSSTKDRMNDGKQPDSSSQPEVSRGGTPLKDKGMLAKSITHNVDADTIMFGSNLEYARIHQLGGTIKPKKGKYLKFKTPQGRWVQVKEVTIPARPFLGISADDIKEIQDTITDYFKKVFHR